MKDFLSRSDLRLAVLDPSIGAWLGQLPVTPQRSRCHIDAFV
jgi:hypothetical protein